MMGNQEQIKLFGSILNSTYKYVASSKATNNKRLVIKNNLLVLYCTKIQPFLGHRNGRLNYSVKIMKSKEVFLQFRTALFFSNYFSGVEVRKIKYYYFSIYDILT